MCCLRCTTKKSPHISGHVVFDLVANSFQRLSAVWQPQPIADHSGQQRIGLRKLGVVAAPQPCVGTGHFESACSHDRIRTKFKMRVGRLCFRSLNTKHQTPPLNDEFCRRAVSTVQVNMLTSAKTVEQCTHQEILYYDTASWEFQASFVLVRPVYSSFRA